MQALKLTIISYEFNFDTLIYIVIQSYIILCVTFKASQIFLNDLAIHGNSQH